MKRKSNTTWSSLCVALVVTCAMAGSVFAHHGWSQYDATKTLNFTGIIRESSYSNPHGLIRLQVNGENGKVRLVGLAPPSRMGSRL